MPAYSYRSVPLSVAASPPIPIPLQSNNSLPFSSTCDSLQLQHNNYIFEFLILQHDPPFAVLCHRIVLASQFLETLSF